MRVVPAVFELQRVKPQGVSSAGFDERLFFVRLLRQLLPESPSEVRLESGNAVPDLSQGVSRGELRPAVEHL